MTDINLSCNCSQVKAIVHDVSPGSGNRLTCYCDDCQSFAKQLNRADDVLDEYGGTDIYQVTPSQIEITHGIDNIRCLRLTSKGLYRWYAGCCNTPIGNTVSGKMPFVGLIHNFIVQDELLDSKIGPVLGPVFEKFATKPLPPLRSGQKSQWIMLLRMLGKILQWKIQGKERPNPFFNSDNKPVCEPKIVD